MPRRPGLPDRRPQGNILRGMAQVARGRADGLAEFGDTIQAFLASLAPLLAFPLVGALLLLTGGHAEAALSELLATLCVLLMPPVLSYEAARLWGRQGQWLRFATAFNWCYWLVPLLGTALVFLLGIANAAGLPEHIGAIVLVVLLSGYGLWLHWFLARHGLQISGLRAALLVLVMNLAVALVVVGPRFLVLDRGG